jgi:hypothetical protein
MIRLPLSVLCGVAIPFLYAVIVGPLTPYIKDNSTLDLLAMVPVRWPVLILYRLGATPFESETAILLYIIVCNVVLYTLLTYFVLWGGSKQKKVDRLTPNPEHVV